MLTPHHTWEFAGSGTNYLALPENGGTKTEAYEQVSEQYGRVYVSGTDELGDFKVGTFARVENRTGAITFTGTVTISEVGFLKLKVVTLLLLVLMHLIHLVVLTLVTLNYLHRRQLETTSLTL